MRTTGFPYIVGIGLFVIFGMQATCWAAPLTILEVQALSFIPVLGGTTQTVVTAPTDNRAAIFNITGNTNVAVTVSIVEPSIEIVNQVGNVNAAKNRMTVDTWTFGGALAADGTAFTDGNGDLNNARLGASVHVSANDIAGDYSGTATFRVVYQ